MNRGRREEETERRHLVIAKGKMDKGDVPRDYTLILHGCLSVTMETVCVYMSRIGELSCVQGVGVCVCYGGECEDAARPPPTVSASIPSKLTVITFHVVGVRVDLCVCSHTYKCARTVRKGGDLIF